MEHHGPVTLFANTFLLFNSAPSSQSPSGNDDYAISYLNTGQFEIKHASENDYFVTWSLSLKTVSMINPPIINLQFDYESTIRNDYSMAALKTGQFSGSSIFHTGAKVQSDILRIGLQLVGLDSTSYTLGATTSTIVNASISILGL